MYLQGFVPSCPRPFAEGRLTVGDHSCPPDFGGAIFSDPWTTGKADFAGQLNFFTASWKEGYLRIRLFQYNIIDKRSGAFRPQGDRVRNGQAANGYGEEEDNHNDDDPIGKFSFHL